MLRMGGPCSPCTKNRIKRGHRKLLGHLQHLAAVYCGVPLPIADRRLYIERKKGQHFKTKLLIESFILLSPKLTNLMEKDSFSTKRGLRRLTPLRELPFQLCHNLAMLVDQMTRTDRAAEQLTTYFMKTSLTSVGTVAEVVTTSSGYTPSCRHRSEEMQCNVKACIPVFNVAAFVIKDRFVKKEKRNDLNLTLV